MLALDATPEHAPETRGLLDAFGADWLGVRYLETFAHDGNPFARAALLTVSRESHWLLLRRRARQALRRLQGAQS